MGNCCLGCCPPSTSQCPSPPPQLPLDPNSQCSSQLPPDSNSQQEQSGQSTKPESSKAREFVTDNVGVASKLLEHISTEAEKLQKTDLPSKFPEEMEKVACRALKGLGNLHWIAVGFSMIAFALERIRQVSSNFEKCVDLLDTMFGLAKCLAEQHRRIPTETESINKAVLAIVDGVITCCSCMTQEKLFKYMFASTDDENLKRIEGVIEKVRWPLSLIMTADLQRQIPRRGDFSYSGEKNVGEKLLYVYHQLREQDKDAFIDVCTYFHGWSKKTVSYILKQREFNALVDGGLVNIHSSDHVVVHDVLRAMGIKLGEDSRVRGDDDWERALARKKEFKGIWLLRDKTEARHVFDEFAETQWVVRGGRKSEIDDVLDIEWQHLSAARVLAVGGRIRFAGECRVSLPKLRFLRFENPDGGFPIFKGMYALQCASLTYYGEDSQRLWDNVRNMPNIQNLKLLFFH